MSYDVHVQKSRLFLDIFGNRGCGLRPGKFETDKIQPSNMDIAICINKRFKPVDVK
jgi:hypothetical protein